MSARIRSSLFTALLVTSVGAGLLLGYESGTFHPSSAGAGDCSDFNNDEEMCVFGVDGCEWHPEQVCEDIVDAMQCGSTAHCVDEYAYDCTQHGEQMDCEMAADQGCIVTMQGCGSFPELDCDSVSGCFWDGASCVGDTFFACEGPAGEFTGCTGGTYEESRCEGEYQICGDGLITGGEQCDDGGADDFDGCSSGCTIEEGWDCYGTPTVCSQCGDGTLNDDFAGEPGEQCDDGNETGGDGCGTFAACHIDPGWTCDGGSPTVCTEDSTCGNGAIDEGEDCDDENRDNDDGCNEDCLVESGYSCVDEPSICRFEVCGDGFKDLLEACDDGNVSDGDGCNALCGEVENGWECTDAYGESSECAPVCGDGLTMGDEQCDDGSFLDIVDGCTSSCTIDDGWSCEGEPSVCMQDPYCGDGEIIEGVEQCDDGNFLINDGCNNSCEIDAGWSCEGAPSMCSEDAMCGNDILDEGEECDDGNTDTDDGCSDVCTVEFSGSGSIDQLIEECDDGNTENGDGCDEMCNVESGWSCQDVSDVSVCTEDAPASSSSGSSESNSSSPSSSSASSSSSAVSPVSPGDPAASQGGGGGRGAARDGVRAPAQGRMTGVMSDTDSEKPSMHTAAPNSLRDVPASDEARQDIEKLAKKGIMTGYADEAGRPKRVFGAADPLTYGQIAKIAVLMGGIDPIASGALKNRTALGDWSEPYVRAAERKGLPAFQAVVPVTSSPSKKEVVETLLKAVGIPYGDALRKAKELGITSDVQKRVLSRREAAVIVSKLLSILEKTGK